MRGYDYNEFESVATCPVCEDTFTVYVEPDHHYEMPCSCGVNLVIYVDDQGEISTFDSNN